MADFISKVHGVFQDAEGVWARFVDGKFSTDEEAIIERLRKVEGVAEVTAEQLAAPEVPEEPAAPPAGTPDVDEAPADADPDVPVDVVAVPDDAAAAVPDASAQA